MCYSESIRSVSRDIRPFIPVGLKGEYTPLILKCQEEYSIFVKIQHICVFLTIRNEMELTREYRAE